MDQNIDFSGSDQIQTPQYPYVHPPSQEISDKVFQAKGDLMKSIQTFLEEFNYIPFEEKPKILLQAWEIFFAIQHAQPEDSNELFQKLLEDLKELAEYVNFLKRDRPIFFDNNEDHFVQNKEFSENSSNEIASSNSNQKPPQDSDIQLVEICRQKELLCMHDNVDDLIKSALNFKLLLINSQRPNKEQQEVKNVVEQPTQRRTRIEESLQNVRVIHKSSISLNNTSQISSVHAVAPILSNKEPEYSPSMGDDDAFEDIEYVEASLPDPEIVSVEEENVVYQEEEEVDLEDISQIQDVILREKLLSINRLIANIESLNDNPTPDCVLNSSVSFPISEESNNSLRIIFRPNSKLFTIIRKRREVERLVNVVKNDISEDSSNDPLLEEADLFLASDNSIPPGIENFGNNSEGDIYFLKELLINDSIPFPNNESSESDFNNPSIPRPLSEPPDAEFDFEEEISVVMIDKIECLKPRDEFDISTNDEDDDYFPFMVVIRIFLPHLIYSKVFSFLLFAESEDTIFDPVSLFLFQLSSEKAELSVIATVGKAHLDDKLTKEELMVC
nr:hypothetical protein [Tanacetum cinerariifolium]